MPRLFAFHETDRRSGSSIKNREAKIRCPKCAWKPGKHDRWLCLCGHVWNTFDTRGLCPGCDAKWKQTQCLKCQQMSLHEAWYDDGSGEP